MHLVPECLGHTAGRGPRPRLTVMNSCSLVLQSRDWWLNAGRISRPGKECHQYAELLSQIREARDFYSRFH
jgi:hypothetical protein